MTRVHQRKDFEYIILKGTAPISGRTCYACVITQSTWSDKYRAIYHVETFYTWQRDEKGQFVQGVSLRALARRYGSAICAGKRSIGGYRTTHIPSCFYDCPIPDNLYSEEKVPLE